MDFRIRDLKNFVRTSQYSTMSQAALALEISQPALSESIKKLEEDIGYILFYRSRSGIQLTPRGREFLEKSQVAILALENLQEEVKSGEIFGKKVIRLGLHATVAQYTLPKAFQHLQKHAPDYKFSIKHGLSSQIQSEIQSGNIDLGIVINPNPVPDLVVRKMEDDIVGVWTSSKNKNMHVLYCNPDLMQTQSLLKKWRQSPKQMVETASLELITEMIAHGLGVGILPQRVVNLHHPELKLLKDAPTYQDQIALVHRPEFGKHISERLTIEALRSVFQ